jgi:hypothetical protein
LSAVVNPAEETPMSTPLRNRFEEAIAKFDAYNTNDPNFEHSEDGSLPKELIYARRMTEKLNQFAPDAPEDLRLAARCQHIGRWEIPRESYPMDRKGYLQWRNTLKGHHGEIASKILAECGYETEVIGKVKSLVLKKDLRRNVDTQVLEDVICLVFIEHYLEDFAAKHEDEKVIEILQKTMKKMSQKAIAEVSAIPVSPKLTSLIQQASSV